MKKAVVLTALVLFLTVSCVLAESKDEQWLNAGVKLYEKGRYEQAILAFEKALAINPDNSYVFQQMGNAYLKLNDHDIAVEYFQRAYDLMPNPALKKKIASLEEKVFGEGKFLLYPVTFEVMAGMGFDFESFYTSGDLYYFRYGGTAAYHLCSWFDIKAGIIGGKRFEIPVLARFSYRLPWNNRTIMGLGAGGYVGLLSPSAVGSDSGVYLSVDAHYVIGPVAIVVNQVIQYGLAQTQRLTTTSFVGLAF